MRRVALAWMVVVAVGCDDPAAAAAGVAVLPATASAANAVPEPGDEQETAADTSADPGVTGPSAGPLRVEPSVTAHGALPHAPGTAKKHASDFGWAADGRSFVLCTDGRSVARACTFTFIDGKAESLAGGASHRLQTAGHDKGPLSWTHGETVTLTWRVPEGKARLEFGARLESGEAVGDLVWMDFDPDLGDDVEIFPEVISVAHDGGRVALVGHAISAAGEHEFKTILLHSDDFAARAFAAAGQDHMSDEKFERAVTAFESAAVAHPSAWEHAYSLACGRARLGSGNVRRALSRAIDLGGAKVRSKAQRDSALASVKRTDWFKAMISG